MKKHILVFQSVKNYKEEIELLASKGFQCTFCQDEEVLYQTIKEDDTVCAVLIFNNTPEVEDRYKKVLKRLKALDVMSTKAIISVVSDETEVDVSELRYFDELVVESATDFFLKYRVDKMYMAVEERKQTLDKIDELLLMYESMSTLVATTFYKTVKRSELHSKRTQLVTNCVAEIYSKKYPERITERDLSIIDNLILLHDIGLTYVDQRVAYQSRMLSREEEMELRKHSLIGGKIFREVKMSLIEKYGRSPKFLEKAIEFTEYHHEYGDGSGYPFGLTLQYIPLYARIVSVAEFIVTELISTENAFNFVMGMLSSDENPKFDQEIISVLIENFDELIVVLEKYDVLEKREDWRC